MADEESIKSGEFYKSIDSIKETVSTCVGFLQGDIKGILDETVRIRGNQGEMQKQIQDVRDQTSIITTRQIEVIDKIKVQADKYDKGMANINDRMNIAEKNIDRVRLKLNWTIAIGVVVLPALIGVVSWLATTYIAHIGG
jgi:uncharacterized protein YoxC